MNIIFDVGGVLLKWKPAEAARRAFSDPAERKRFLKEVIQQDVWKDFDAGRISSKDLVRSVHETSGISTEGLNAFIREIPNELVPMQDTLKLVDDLIDAGHKLYILSNMPYEIAEYIQNRDAFWDKFTGKVFSGYVHMIKPDREIYDHISSEYELIPEETFFIDDYEINIETAKSIGFRTHLFRDAETCREDLRSEEVIL